jgi:hypothetical protein
VSRRAAPLREGKELGEGCGRLRLLIVLSISEYRYTEIGIIDNWNSNQIDTDIRKHIM